MAHRNKARGDQYERDVLKMVRDYGFGDAKRTRAGRREDEGDIHVDRDVTAILQTKDAVALEWKDWLEGLQKQIACAGAEYGALVVKRRATAGRPKPLHLAVVPLDDYLKLLRDVGVQQCSTTT